MAPISATLRLASGLLLLGYHLVTCSTARAAEQSWDDALVTDRPDAAESSQTVGKSVLQIETSLLWGTDRAERNPAVRSLAFPTLMRYGLTDLLELRLETDVWQESHDSGTRQRQSGLSDTGLGLKWHTWSSETLSTALLFSVNLPSGEEPFSSEEPEFTATLALDGDLGEGLGIGTNWGASRVVNETGNGYATRLHYAVAVGGPLHPRWSWFLEVFGSAVPGEESSADEASVDGGLKFLLSPDLQLDLAVAHGLTEAAADFEATFGLSYRLRLGRR